jgi:hypothetical protein
MTPTRRPVSAQDHATMAKIREMAAPGKGCSNAPPSMRAM